MPQIIMEKGGRVKIRKAGQNELHALLKEKFYEEAGEFFLSQEKEEFADILKVFHEIARSRGWGMNEIDDIRKRKAEKRGDFSGGIILESVED